jgi:hypothetical protein
MMHFWIPLVFSLGQVSPQRAASSEPVLVRYATATVGRQVTVVLDGKVKKPTFAGRLGFQDVDSSWTSFCADVRSPMNRGRMFNVQPISSKTRGGNIAKAGNIVAKYFKAARTYDECAGLQLAIWEAVEDGNAQPDFNAGRFGAIASPLVLKLATQFYEGINQDGNAMYLMQVGGPGGSSGGGQNQFRGGN